MHSAALGSQSHTHICPFHRHNYRSRRMHRSHKLYKTKAKIYKIIWIGQWFRLRTLANIRVIPVFSIWSIESSFACATIASSCIVLTISAHRFTFAFIERAMIGMAIAITGCSHTTKWIDNLFRHPNSIWEKERHWMASILTFTFKRLLFCVWFPQFLPKSRLTLAAANALSVVLAMISKRSTVIVEMAILLTISQNFDVLDCIEKLKPSTWSVSRSIWIANNDGSTYRFADISIFQQWEWIEINFQPVEMQSNACGTSPFVQRFRLHIVGGQLVVLQ